MKILFSCRAFGNVAGGVERQAIYVMNDMIARGHDVHLLTWDEAGAEAFYEMSPKINWIKMNMGNYKVRASVLLRLKRLLFIRRTVRKIKPDVAIGFQYGAFITPRMACLGMGFPMIQAERNSVSLMDHTSAGKRRNRIFQSMRMADKITVQCPSYVTDYPDYLRHKIVVIPNPVFPAKNFANPEGDGNSKERILLSVGRLNYQKNMDALVQAFAKISPQFPQWILKIAGDGEDRTRLEQMLRDLNVENQVKLLGAVKDVPSLYVSSHLLCLSSRWEGFPNVIAESSSHGLPCVGYRGCAGMPDLIEDGKTGALAKGNGNIDSLAQTLSKLMADDKLRKQMGKAAIESMKQYAPDKMLDLWEKLFVSLAKRG